MFLDLSMGPPSLQFGITIRAWSLVCAADAFVSSGDSLKAMDLIALRCRQGNLRVHIPRSRRQGYYMENPEGPNIFKVGIASIPLELLLAFRETIIDSALNDAEQKYLECVKAAHERRNRPNDHVPFSQCLHSAARGRADHLCDACATCVEPRALADHKAIEGLLSSYSLSLVSSSTSTPLLTSPPYFPIEPHPWVVALTTHHSQPMSRSGSGLSFLPVHTPSPHRGLPLPSTGISFFSPSFMRITSSNIMRFRNLVRTWRLAVVELSGTVASRGSESVQSRSSSRLDIPGAMVDIDAVDRLSTMGHCEPRWMLLNPNKLG